MPLRSATSRFHVVMSRGVKPERLLWPQARGIAVMPEIDLPGHCFALVRARPDLVDPEKPLDAYGSVHDFSKNAINPAAGLNDRPD